MSIATGNNRKRIREMLRLHRSKPGASRDPDDAGLPRGSGEDIVLASTSRYESGIITRLDLRLVDLYGDCAFESEDPTPTEGNAFPC